MKDSGESYTKVRYDLRPAKQVERMMLVDAFQVLAHSGVPITSYRYVGMGSVHFYDYSLFHKYLGIDKLLSVEASEKVRKRVEFNKPFSNVDVAIATIGSVIPTLSRDERHILWLDYDQSIQSAFVEDLTQAVGGLSVGSIILITVDVEPAAGVTKPKDIKAEILKAVGSALPDNLPLAAFKVASIHLPSLAVLSRAIERGLVGRRQVAFKNLFSFLYKDGHRMLTIGGIIADTATARQVDASMLSSRIYFRDSLQAEPYVIRVPVLTRKEKIHLDQHMPALGDWYPSEFELDQEDFEAYKEIYRFNPMYGELLL